MSTVGQDMLNICARASAIGIPLVGRSEAFLELIRKVERVARHGEATVLIRGETGTGKELIARATHYLGMRSSCPFVPINCGALPETLMENELFGHRAGAYTGAITEGPGLIRLADRGTLFLDEVDALPMKAQVALLRFLQDGHYRPLGGQREERSNVRIVAACNSSLETEVEAGRFRRDLYYRLNVLSIDVPPLRARSVDIPLLADHFLRECARRYSSFEKTLDSHTLSWFVQYSWPGNIRELENLLHRAYLMCEDCELRIRQPTDFARTYNEQTDTSLRIDVAAANYQAAKAMALEQFDRSYLSQVLALTEGNITKAARLAGKERRALGKLLKRYRISYSQEGHDPSPKE